MVKHIWYSNTLISRSVCTSVPLYPNTSWLSPCGGLRCRCWCTEEVDTGGNLCQFQHKAVGGETPGALGLGSGVDNTTLLGGMTTSDSKIYQGESIFEN